MPVGSDEGSMPAEDDERGASRGSRRTRPVQAPAGEGPFDWRGWVLVAVTVVTFLVVPVAILVSRRAQGVVGAFGLPWQDAYWALPMIPAVLLAATAVWAALGTQRE